MTNDEKTLLTDYEESKATYKELLKQGLTALKLAKDIADDTEHPRSIEVFSGLIKNVTNINSKIMDLNKKYQDIIKRDSYKEPEQLSTNTTNNVFIGSTSELQKMLVDNMKIISHESNDA